MALIATLVVGSNGATSKGGQSSPLSTPPDRARFLDLHRSAAAIIIGSKSALIEDYSRTTVPILVFSRAKTVATFAHPMMQQITVSDNLAQICREIDSHNNGNVIIEAGVELLTALIDAGAVDHLALSLSPIEGDGDFIDVATLLSHCTIESDVNVDGTRLLECRYESNSANG